MSRNMLSIHCPSTYMHSSIRHDDVKDFPTSIRVAVYIEDFLELRQKKDTWLACNWCLQSDFWYFWYLLSAIWQRDWEARVHSMHCKRNPQPDGLSPARNPFSMNLSMQDWPKPSAPIFTGKFLGPFAWRPPFFSKSARFAKRRISSKWRLSFACMRGFEVSGRCIRISSPQMRTSAA